MTENEIHLKLSDVKIDNDNLDYIKATGEICGKLRWDLVKLFAIPDVSQQREQLIDFYNYFLKHPISKTIVDDYLKSKEGKSINCG